MDHVKSAVHVYLHGVVDSESIMNRPTRGIYIQVNWLCGILRFQEQQLGNDAAGYMGVYITVQANHAIF